MKKILTLLLSLCVILFAESHEMRIGESQYFTNEQDGKKIKVTLEGVQNGVAILKKELVEEPISEVQYYYFAPESDIVAPIVLQPYPETVYSSTIKIEGICEPGYALYVWNAGADKNFKTATKTLLPVQYNGGNFSLEVPLSMGSNTYYIAYAEGVVGTRAELTVNRVDAPSKLLSIDLDPIGSDDIRKTGLVIPTAKPGHVEAIEMIADKQTVKTQQSVGEEGSFAFVAENTFTDALERSFDVSLFDYKNDLVASNTIVVPVSEIVPECSMTFESLNFTPSHTMNGSFSASEGVRFVWARIIDFNGAEYGRAFFDIGKMETGFFSMEYNDLASLRFRVYDQFHGMKSEKTLALPKDQIKAGYEYYLEMGVTDVAGNRSNTYLFNLFEAELEKMIVIPLENAVPTTDVVDYPVLVQLNHENFDFSKSLETGDDVVFMSADGKTLHTEKEYFSREEEKAFFWVNVPLVRAASSRIQLKVRWSNPLADAYSGTAVWNDSYQGVYHFNEEARGPYVIPERKYSKYVVYTTGNLTLGDRTVLNGTYKSNGMDELIVEPLPIPGTREVVVRSGAEISLTPGKYADLSMGDNCKLNLSAGTYHFKNISVGNGSTINADVSAGVVAIKVDENVRVNERTALKLVGKDDPSAVRLDVMGSEIYFGSDVKWNAILTAPNAQMRILERGEWNGALYVQQLSLGMDVTVNASESHDVYAYVPNAIDMFPPKSITAYALYAKQNLKLNNQVRISGTVGSEKNVVVAEGSAIDGNMVAWGDVELRSQSSLSGKAVVGGHVNEGYNVNWSGNVTPLSQKNPISVEEFDVQIGTEQVVFQRGSDFVIEPGAYERLEVQDGATAFLLEGQYSFGSIVLRNNASLELISGDRFAEISVSNSIVVDNGVKLNTLGNNVTLKYAGTSEVRFGNECKLNAAIILPNSDVVLGDRSSLKGFLMAQNITFGNQAVFTHSMTSFPEDVTVADAPYTSDWIADATAHTNNGYVQMGYAEAGYIANNEYFGIDGSFILKNGNYFKNHEGTISAWVYFDGAEGKFMASSDDVVPDWSLERTLEGHVVFKAGSASMLFPVPEQSWAYLTFAVNGTRVDAYVNGEFVKSLTIAALDDIMTPWVGVTGDGLFKIDELRFMNKVLSKEWIRMDYVTQKLNKNEEGVGEYALAF